MATVKSWMGLKTLSELTWDDWRPWVTLLIVAVVLAIAVAVARSCRSEAERRRKEKKKEATQARASDAVTTKMNELDELERMEWDWGRETTAEFRARTARAVAAKQQQRLWWRGDRAAAQDDPRGEADR
jgi:predicted lysophospholipase L1 biosynthesis ABC-type transport system permease subunit